MGVRYDARFDASSRVCAREGTLRARLAKRRWQRGPDEHASHVRGRHHSTQTRRLHRFLCASYANGQGCKPGRFAPGGVVGNVLMRETHNHLRQTPHVLKTSTHSGKLNSSQAKPSPRSRVSVALRPRCGDKRLTRALSAGSAREERGSSPRSLARSALRPSAVLLCSCAVRCVFSCSRPRPAGKTAGAWAGPGFARPKERCCMM